tara:strand:- start:86 stop:658 length:573 start_codon:yes stop_codon:yes gene_type:complete
MNQATPDDFKAGTSWYETARQDAERMAVKHRIPTEVAAHAIAALSPGVRWATNLRAAETLLESRNFSEQVVPGYPKNVLKAKRIISSYFYPEEGRSWRDWLSGPKVTAFAANIVDPNRTQQVTLDTHAISVALGIRYTTKETPDLRKEEFQRITRAYEKVAEEYKISPNSCQAITWLVWRKLHTKRRGKK